MAILAMPVVRAGGTPVAALACDFIQVTDYSIRSPLVAGLPSAFCLLPCPVVLQHLNGLRMHFFARLQSAAVANDHRFTFREARDNFRVGGGFEAQS